MKRMLLFDSAASTAMLVWPHRPKMHSTPRSSRYSTSWFATGSLATTSFMTFLRFRRVGCSCPDLFRARREWTLGRAGVVEGDAGRHGTFDAATLLPLLPGMGQDAHRARENEQATAQLGRKPQLRVDDRR